MPKDKHQSPDHFTPDQIEELQGEYKHSDNPIPQNTKRKFALEKGDGVSTKRPQ